MMDNNRRVSLLFAGDFAPCRRFEKIVLTEGKKIFGDLQEDIGKADLSFVNLESPLCTNGNAIKKIGPNLHAHPDCLYSLSEAGFDVIGLANNHIMDFGEVGLAETIASCRGLNLSVCGAGNTLQNAQRPLVLDAKVAKVAYIAISENEFSIARSDKAGAAPLDPIDNTRQIESARKKADFVFVSLHGGNEYFPYPRPGLRKICRFFIERGADAVICHHAHVPGAYEFFNDKPIIYSLGNLIFDNPKPPSDWDKGYAVVLDYSIETKILKNFQILPYSQSVSQSGIVKLKGGEKQNFLERVAGYNDILTDKDAYRKTWDDFCEKMGNSVLFKHYFPVQFRGMGRLSQLVNPEWFLVPTQKSKRIKLNMVRCESHLELLQSILACAKSGRL